MRQRARKATKRAHTTFGVQANWGGMNVHYDRMVLLRFESFCYVPCYRAASRVDGVSARARGWWADAAPDGDEGEARSASHRSNRWNLTSHAASCDAVLYVSWRADPMLHSGYHATGCRRGQTEHPSCSRAAQGRCEAHRFKTRSGWRCATTTTYRYGGKSRDALGVGLALVLLRPGGFKSPPCY